MKSNGILQRPKLVESQQKSGHCQVPKGCKQQSKSLFDWVSGQWKNHTKKKLQQDRKDLLSVSWGHRLKELMSLRGKMVALPAAFPAITRNGIRSMKNWSSFNDRESGHRIVPNNKCEQDKTFGQWVDAQRTFHNNGKMRQH